MNRRFYNTGATALHVACCGKDRQSLLPVLLSHPKINVNSIHDNGDTVLHYAVDFARSETLKILLADPRVDASLQGSSRGTALWSAVRKGSLENIKLLIASGKDLGHIKPSKINFDAPTKTSTPLELAAYFEAKSKSEVYPHIGRLLERLVENEHRVRFETRRELGLGPNDPELLFATTVLLCDDFYTISPAGDSSSSRFFKILKKLPMELQMVISNMTYGIAKESIPRSLFEGALKTLAEGFM